MSNMHTDASRAEQEAFYAFTLGSDASIADNRFAEVLWILVDRYCHSVPFHDVAYTVTVSTPQIGATASILLLDRFVLSLLTTNEKPINSFASTLQN